MVGSVLSKTVFRYLTQNLTSLTVQQSARGSTHGLTGCAGAAQKVAQDKVRYSRDWSLRLRGFSLQMPPVRRPPCLADVQDGFPRPEPALGRLRAGPPHAGNPGARLEAYMLAHLLLREGCVILN